MFSIVKPIVVALEWVAGAEPAVAVAVQLELGGVGVSVGAVGEQFDQPHGLTDGGVELEGAVAGFAAEVVHDNQLALSAAVAERERAALPAWERLPGGLREFGAACADAGC